MTNAFTAKTKELKGRGKTVLKGDPKKPESAQHIIYFPGGSIEVSRTTDGDYWVHISANRRQVTGDAGTVSSKRGTIIDSRVDYEHPIREIGSIPNETQIEHLAVRIKTTEGD